MNDLTKQRKRGSCLRLSLFFSLILSIFLSLCLGACIPSNIGGGFLGGRTQADYDSIRQSQQNSAEVIRRTSNIYAGENCSEQERNHECYEDCDKIYKSKTDQKKCEGLTVRQIEKIKEVYDVLERAKEDDLNDINVDVFELYLKPSIQSIDDLIYGFKKKNFISKAENIFIWLTENEDMAMLFEEKDRDYKTFNNLLNAVEPFNPNQVYLPFSKIVRKSDTIMDIVVQQPGDDSFALDWFMDFIEESPNCESDTIAEDCFEVYCKIANEMNTDEKDRLLRMDIFDKYLNDIIEEEININNWNPPNSKTVEDIKETDDLGDDWVSNLCDGLT